MEILPPKAKEKALRGIARRALKLDHKII